MPILSTIVLLFMVGILFTQSTEVGIIGLIFVLIYLGFILGYYIRIKPEILTELMGFALEQGQIQHQLLKSLELPYILCDMKGKIIWYNDAFHSMVTEEDWKRKHHIQQLFEELGKDQFPLEDDHKEIEIRYNSRHYSVKIRRVCEEELLEGVKTQEDTTVHVLDENTIFAFYFYDHTELQQYIKENKEQCLVAGLIYIDNYEEVLDSIEEVRQSLLVALIDRKINKYMQNVDAICKKIEKDKFIVVFKQKYLPQLQSTKFSILDEVRSINIGNDLAVTLSISIGINSQTYIQAYEEARLAMDLALGRGGDQAVVKNGDKISYYGGKTQVVEKSTRVKARVKAHALREIMETKDEVVIMGHRFPDVDSLGAALGIYRLAKTLNKRAHIVINEATISIRPIMNNFIDNESYEEDLFIDSAKAMAITKPSTLLVVVDVNRPSYTECKELLSLTKSIVVFDHHRQTNEVIENAVLSYIEPYASSSCEMVAEILQYIPDKPKLKPIEADAMYSGMIVDTDTFVTKTGVRTFEAAAFLKRNGADVVRVRKMFRNSMESYKLRAEVIRQAEVYLDEFAISVLPSSGVDSPNVLAAQAANELLDIEGIRASFVMTEIGRQIFISARSIDDVNVQIIMEQLGGGGHLNVAGAQLNDISVEETIWKLKQILETMKTEGDI
ncbi:MAG: DHH family phosphoesterase [Firmicutes bacterium]|uniref:Cyclic-di-AMP phosphodiesterase n=1 Tax=Candidatus Scybalomonas excrementavium TaxID=2840943 RepID=A0A9D9I1M7_9FIRM|nr:DHH family phosphoesterase [Candidatus Scybalomonas excrementavium]